MISPGIHLDLSNEDYHADTDYLSSSKLKAALPERYKAGGSQDALDFGTLFHTVVLEPENLSGYTVLDANKIGLKSDGTVAQNPTMTAAWKKAVAEAESDGKVVIAQADWDRAHAMRDAVTQHPTANALIYGEGPVEESAFWVDENGVAHKARFDKRVPGAIVDLKSTASQPGGENLAKAVVNYGYDLSASHYLEVAAGLELDAADFALVFVGKEFPYRVTVAELDDMFLIRGRLLRSLAIERHLNPAAPPYEGAHGHLTLTAPRWALNDLEIPA